MSRFLARRDRLRKYVKKAGADALLVTNRTNVTYLTGFTGEDSFLLVGAAGDDVLLSDGRFSTQLAEECPGLDCEIRGPGKPMSLLVAKAVAKAKWSRLAFEADSVTVAQHHGLAEKMPKVQLGGKSHLVERRRIVKDREEIAAIRQAVDYAQRAFAVLRATLTGDQTEKQVADALEHQLRLFGAKGVSFETIVAVGPRAALPHARPTKKKIGENPFVLVDWGADGGQYKSDLTRVLATAKIPPKLERIYGVVLKSQLAAIAAIRPGRTCEEIDSAAREVIEKAGFGRYFSHGLGHGIGLDIHEAPRLGQGNKQKLTAGMVITVEPGIYLPGFGGVRIEDDVLVTKNGHEVLSDAPKQWDEMHVG